MGFHAYKSRAVAFQRGGKRGVDFRGGIAVFYRKRVPAVGSETFPYILRERQRGLAFDGYAVIVIKEC